MSSYVRNMDQQRHCSLYINLLITSFGGGEVVVRAIHVLWRGDRVYIYVWVDACSRVRWHLTSSIVVVRGFISINVDAGSRVRWEYVLLDIVNCCHDVVAIYAVRGVRVNHNDHCQPIEGINILLSVTHHYIILRVLCWYYCSYLRRQSWYLSKIFFTG